MRTAALIVAAGRGSRAGGPAKQWRPIAGRRVVDWTVEAFARHPRIDAICLVVPQGHGQPLPPVDLVAEGGDSRAASVRAGLAALAPLAPGRVLIHDVARPAVSAAVIDRVLTALDTAPGAAPALPVTDALWTGAEGRVTGTRDRTGLYRAQTPQGFHFAAIRDAHAAHAGDAADDVEVARAAGLPVAIVEGDTANIKITLPTDFARAARLLTGGMDVRTGTGFDVHRFGAGDHVMLCGVRVPYGRGLQGHSDADVGLHAVADAIYGALAEGDIGRHFPPSEARWKGADSAVFATHAAARIAARGFRLSSLDTTLICERPKIGPHADAMRARLATLLSAEADRISVKATTTERLGFPGREEGIACLATVTLLSP